MTRALAAWDPDPGTSTIWIPCPSETVAESVVSWHAAAVVLLPPLAEQESDVAEQLVPVPEQCYCDSARGKTSGWELAGPKTAWDLLNARIFCGTAQKASKIKVGRKRPLQPVPTAL